MTLTAMTKMRILDAVGFVVALIRVVLLNLPNAQVDDSVECVTSVTWIE